MTVGDGVGDAVAVGVGAGVVSVDGGASGDCVSSADSLETLSEAGGRAVAAAGRDGFDACPGLWVRGGEPKDRLNRATIIRASAATQRARTT